MTIDALKTAKLSSVTAGYLAVYLKLSNLLGEVSEITEREYSSADVDNVNDGFNKAIYGALDEIMKLVADSIVDKICYLDNNDEI